MLITSASDSTRNTLARVLLACYDISRCQVEMESAGRLTLVDGQLQSSSIDVYLALEYCNGGDLHALMGQLSEAQIQSLMHQLLTGVSYMHALNVWHRDLKSANVLLRVHEGQYIAAIADLGA